MSPFGSRVTCVGWLGQVMLLALPKCDAHLETFAWNGIEMTSHCTVKVIASLNVSYRHFMLNLRVYLMKVVVKVHFSFLSLVAIVICKWRCKKCRIINVPQLLVSTVNRKQAGLWWRWLRCLHSHGVRVSTRGRQDTVSFLSSTRSRRQRTSFVRTDQNTLRMYLSKKQYFVKIFTNSKNRLVND